ncbi:MAG: double-strand break repair protein AddB, partial [bacterium]
MNRQGTSPNVCTVPPGVPFLPSLARDLLARIGSDDPLGLARVTVFLPTRRSVRGLREELRRQAETREQSALLLPEVHALGDVDEDGLLLSLPRGAADADFLSPAIGDVRRQVLLAQLIERWSTDRHRAGDAFAVMGPAQAMALAAELARFLDHLHTEDASLNRLADLAPAQHSGHWEMTVAFLSILSHHWPEILRGENAIDPGERRSRLLRALARKWQEAPPEQPVIAAGSTGSIPATSDLLHVIARLPRGEVWLPGLDLDLDEESWAHLDPPHPQFGLKHLLGRLGVGRSEVSVCPRESGEASTARERLWSTAFRPAATTGAWPELAAAAAAQEALSGLYRIDADDSAQEAGIIACILRRALETPGRTAALVTPDRDLARRVTAELRRWEIDIDDSAGQPLAGTRTGTFLRCLLEAVKTRFAPVALLSLLKHELCRLGLNPEEKDAAVPVLERAALRGLKPAPGLAPLRERLERAQHRGHDAAGALRLIERLEEATAPLIRLANEGRAPLADLARVHIEAADALAGTEEDKPWDGDDGTMARAFLCDLTEQEDGPEWSLPDYAGAVSRCLQARAVHARRPGHPRLFIWGPLEARLQYTDVIILGGLNEGTWPAPPAPDPWLNRRMQAELGLPDPDRRVGQAAHDFAQLACAEEVYLTRSARVEGAPQLPSRWLLRLDAVLKAAGTGPGALQAPEAFDTRFKQLDRRKKRVRIADPRPAPPAAARLKQ